MSTCERCGVEWEDEDKLYLPEAPCVDCQPWYEEDFRKFSTVREDEKARGRRLVKRLWERRYSDSEIAEALGMRRNSVRYIRRDLNLEAHQFSGSEKWRNPEEALKKMSEASKAFWAENPGHKPNNKRAGVTQATRRTNE